MSELTLTLVKLGYLAVLWLFVLSAVSVMRSDLFGSRLRQQRATRGPVPRAAPRPAKPPKRRNAPRKLVVTGGSLVGTSVSLGDVPVTIGRAQDSTVVLDDDYASSRHARLFPRDGQWLVEDLGSTNGTYLDREKVTAPTAVPLGVPIRIGKTVLELRK
jgi:pSer/pThr/pTyr-binding forkhead associated (FHA) protein